MRRLRGVALAALFLAGLVAPARADQLFLTFPDPVGDNTGPIDVTALAMMFDNTTGAYTVVLKATASAPFIGEFWPNVNLWNPTASSYFFHPTPPVNLATSQTVFILTGTNPELLAWHAGDVVASNTLAGFGNPPDITLFRTGVPSFPYTFLTNEDSIAYGATGSTVVTPLMAQEAVEMASAEVQYLLETGALDSSQASALQSRLTTALDELNAAASLLANGDLHAFSAQVLALLSSGALSDPQAQALFNSADAARTAPIAAGSSLEVSGSKVGIYVYGPLPSPVGTRYHKIAVSFSTTIPIEDVTIDVGLGSISSPVQAFLMTQIGSSATIANQIAASTYSGAPGPHVPLFHHLSLAAGTYSLVLYTEPAANTWNRLLPFTVNASPGMSFGPDYFGFAFNDYPPATPFFFNPHRADEGALQFRVGPTKAFAGELIAKLITDVVAMNLRAGISNGLDAKLDAVVDALNDTQTPGVGALAAMDAFVNAVEAQRGKQLTDVQADALIASANRIIQLLAP